MNYFYYPIGIKKNQKNSLLKTDNKTRADNRSRTTAGAGTGTDRDRQGQTGTDRDRHPTGAGQGLLVMA
ncbi:MAG: hypothetical protein ACOC56_02355 [Atribacterota bacterium]